MEGAVHVAVGTLSYHPLQPVLVRDLALLDLDEALDGKVLLAVGEAARADGVPGGALLQTFRVDFANVAHLKQ